MVFITYRIRFASAESARKGEAQLARAGFAIEAVDEAEAQHALDAAIGAPSEDEADKNLHAVRHGIPHDPVIAYQTARLDGFL